MNKFLVYYDTKMHITVICKCKIINNDVWGNCEVLFNNSYNCNNGYGLTHKENVFDTLEEARKYAGHSNRIEVV